MVQLFRWDCKLKGCYLKKCVLNFSKMHSAYKDFSFKLSDLDGICRICTKRDFLEKNYENSNWIIFEKKNFEERYNNKELPNPLNKKYHGQMELFYALKDCLKSKVLETYGFILYVDKNEELKEYYSIKKNSFIKGSSNWDDFNKNLNRLHNIILEKLKK